MTRTRKGSRAAGMNPRALKTNPRALGTNPRAISTFEITERSPKEELVTSAVECIDTQAEQIKQLQQQQQVLIAIAGVLLLWGLL